MTTRHPLDREILGLAVPALGALAADPLVSMVDTAFVGRLGVTPLGARVTVRPPVSGHLDRG